MGDGGKRASQAALVAFQLKRTERWLCCSAGVGLSSVGSVAIFLGHDGAAVTALIGFGGFALLVGALGKLPARAKFKDYELEMGQSEKSIVDNLASVVPAQDLQRALRETPNLDGPVAKRLTEHALFEAEMIDVVTRASSQIGATILPPRKSPSASWDIVVEKRNKRIYFEIKLRCDGSALNAVFSRAEQLEEGSQAVLICWEISGLVAARSKFTKSVLILAPAEGLAFATEVERAVQDLLVENSA